MKECALSNPLASGEPQTDISAVIETLTQRWPERVSRAEAVRQHHANTMTWHRPQMSDAVFFAESTPEVQEAVRLCAQHGAPIIAFGTGTSLEGQVNAPFGGLCIDLSRMNAIVAVNDDDLTCTVQAGVTRKQLNDHLRDKGLFFPIDPGADASLGGMAATRASGTNAVRYGTMRENVIALEVVMPDGRIGSPLARGATAVRALADAHLSGTTPPSATIPHPGTPATNLAIAPQLALPALDGTPATLATLGVEARPVVLVFTDPHCEPCDALLPELLAWQRNAGERAQLALVSRGSVDENRLMGDRTGIDGTIPVLIQHGMETIAAYGIHQAPAAVLVTRGGRWDGQPAYGETGVRSILQRALSPEANGVAQIRHHSNHPAQQPVPRPEIGEGDRVPLITLPDLAGSPRPLIDPNGLTGDRVLLFWRATCGYCQRMLPRLRAWEATRAAGDPELIVIATSSAAEMTLQGFASHVLLDHGVGVGRRFGSRGTPSAVRVSAEGVVVAPIASGAEAVLRLIDDPQRQTRDAADSLRT